MSFLVMSLIFSFQYSHWDWFPVRIVEVIFESFFLSDVVGTDCGVVLKNRWEKILPWPVRILPLTSKGCHQSTISDGQLIASYVGTSKSIQLILKQSKSRSVNSLDRFFDVFCFFFVRLGSKEVFVD